MNLDLTQTYDGLQVAELGRSLGLRLDARDREKLEQVFAVDEKNRPAEAEVWVTGDALRVRRVLITASLGWLLLTQERRSLWTSPRQADVEYDQVRALITDPANHQSGVMHHIRVMRAAHGAQEIESHRGTRLLFRGRAGSGHRGLAVTRLIIEGHADVQALARLMPCLMGQPAGQLIRALVNETAPA